GASQQIADAHAPRLAPRAGADRSGPAVEGAAAAIGDLPAAEPLRRAGPPGAVADCTACDSEPTLWPEGQVLPTGRVAEMGRAHGTHGFADRIIEQGSGINVGERELVDEVAAETTHEILDAGGGVRRLDRHIRLHDLAVRVADSREDNGGLGKDVAFANAGF